MMPREVYVGAYATAKEIPYKTLHATCDVGKPFITKCITLKLYPGLGNRDFTCHWLSYFIQHKLHVLYKTM